MILRTALILASLTTLISLPKSVSAAFITFTNEASYNTAKAALFQVAATTFDSTTTGNKTSSFALGGIGFTGSTENAPGSPGSPVPLNLGVSAGVTSSAANFLGVFDPFDPGFNGGASPAFGDRVTMAVPGNSRSIGLRIITDTVPDAILSFGRLSVGSTNVDTLAGTGTAISGGFQSYFVGIVGNLPADIFSSATVGFVGGGSFYRVDNIGVFAVPEPTSFALVAIAGMAGLMRRRLRTA